MYEKYVILNPDEPWNLTSDIYMYDLSAKKETRITTNGDSFAPDIYSNKIVWDNDGIFLYDLSTKKVTKIAEDRSDPDMGYSLYYNNPAIYGNRIAWARYEYTTTSSESLEVYNLSTKQVTYITGGEGDTVGSPDINNNRVVWAGWTEEYGSNICVYDLLTKKGTLIPSGGSDPRIYGNRIVWGNSIYDLSTKNETQITTNGSASNPRIYGDRIVWQDSRNGKSDIYMATLTVIADFSASPTSGKAPLKVQFTEESIGKPTKWKWSFGDGTSSTKQNPTHNYSKVGSYTVKLTATNDKGSHTVTITEYIKVVTKPVASFSAKPTSGKAPLTAVFTDKSTGIPTKWKWSFGDGKTSTVQNPKHQYLQEGKYKVTLTVTNAAGSSTATKTNYIAVTTNTRPGI